MSQEEADVSVEILKSANEYLVRRQSGRFDEVGFTFDSTLEQDLEAVRKFVPDRSSPDPTKLLSMGQRLAKFFVGEPALSNAEQNAPLQVTIGLQPTALEVDLLPWELTPVGSSTDTLATRANCLLRYELVGTQTTPRVNNDAEGRILFAWSNAGEDVPADAHSQALQNACGAGRLRFAPAEDELANQPFRDIANRLEQAIAEKRPYSILHILCHGGRIKTDKKDERKTNGFVWRGNFDDSRENRIVIDPMTIARNLREFSSTLRLVVLCVCNSGDSGQVDNPMRSVAQHIHQAGIEAVVASRFLLTIEGSILFAEEFYAKLLVDMMSLEKAFLSARKQLFRQLSTDTVDYAFIQLWARQKDGWDTRPIVFRPYRGIVPFAPEHAKFFFGRTEEIAGWVKRIAQSLAGELPRFQVLAAASGTGKSSLMLAGVVPKLVARGHSYGVFRPASTTAQDMAAVMDSDEVKGASKKNPHLIIVDQLEEIFTHFGTAKERNEFVQVLSRLAQLPYVVVLCTLRVDFLGRCGEVLADDSNRGLDQIVYDGKHRVFLGRLTREQLAEIIEGPAKLVGLEFAPGLVEKMLDHVGNNPGALPLLEHALDQLWEKREGRLLTHAAYLDIGRVYGALTKTADSALAELGINPEETGSTNDALVQAQRIVVSLVDLRDDTTLDARRRAYIDEERPLETHVAERNAFDRVLEKLVEKRLVIKGEEQYRVFMEFAHDALLREWKVVGNWARKYREITLERRELEAQAAQWTANREATDRGASYLLAGPRLARVLKLVEQVKVSPTACQFVDVSAEEQERRVESPLDDLEEQGWGVIAPEGTRGDQLLELIRPLIQHRGALQGYEPRIFRVPPNLDEMGTIRWRQSQCLNPDLPRKQRPHYLLILGDLHEVSLEMQQALTGDMMLGRIAFRQDEQYAVYARKVVRFETEKQNDEGARLGFFAAKDGTAGTTVGNKKLVQLCLDDAQRAEAWKNVRPRSVDEIEYQPASTESLLQWAAETHPSVLFSMSHGLTKPRAGWSLEEQRELQGSLVIGPGVRLTGQDLRECRFLPGGFWGYFATSSAGAAARSDVYGIIVEGSQIPQMGIRRPDDALVALTPRGVPPFITNLSQTALGNAEGPLGILGIIDLAWTVIFDDASGKPDPARFVELLRQVCRGGRFGAALTRFNLDILAMNAELSYMGEVEANARATGQESPVVPSERIKRRLTRNSLRNFVLLGDPAARLAVRPRGGGAAYPGP